MRRRQTYAVLALVVLACEVLIAVFLHDPVVRPYVGDSLAVILVYLTVRAATPLGPGRALGIALAVALAVELAQLWNLLDAVGLRQNRLARTVLGGHFDLGDFAAYTVGGLAVWLLDRRN